MALLSDAKARNLKFEDGAVAHGGVTGLTLHPTTSKGHGKWVLRYVSPVTGKRRNAGLGSYPSIGVAEAAKKATEMRAQLSQGSDPLEVKADLQDLAPTPTFQAAAEMLHLQLVPGWKNTKHGAQWINTLREYAFPAIGAMTLDQIGPKNIADALRPIWLTKSETAGRVRQRISAVMAWGWAHGYCTSDPTNVVSHLLPQQLSKAIRTKHQPAMPWREIPLFIRTHLRSGDSRDMVRMMLEFLILTGCRSGEVRGMTWSEINFSDGIWSVPAERMKAKQDHRVPLSRRALEILTIQLGAHEALVFPSPRDRVELSDMALTALLRRLKAKSDTVKRVATAHGFRSSFRDWCSEKGIPRDLAERALAHAVQNKVEAAYHRTDLLELRRPMMEAWAEFLES